MDCSDSTFHCINKGLFFLCLVSLVVTLSGSPAKDLLYQAANLTRQLLSCLLASPVVMDFLNECLSFSRFHTFLSVLLGPTPDQIFCHWLWFLKVSDPSLQASPALPEIWPHFGSPCLILYTLMQSERLNSLSLHPLPPDPPTYAHPTSMSLETGEEVECRTKQTASTVHDVIHSSLLEGTFE